MEKNELAKKEVAMSMEQLKEVLPNKLSEVERINLLGKVNQTLCDPGFAKELRDSYITYSKVLKEGKYKLEDYFTAVRYVSFRSMGFNNRESYAKAMPDRMQAHIDAGRPPKDINAYVAMYNKGKLVTAIMEQSLIPFHLENADNRQAALNHQLHLMKHANSEKVQMEAANSILVHTKGPENAKIELDINVDQSRDQIEELRTATAELANQTKRAIDAGLQTAKDAAHAKIINGECTNVD